MPSRLQTDRLWTKEQLVDRAKVWARGNRHPEPTIATFLKWKQEGLIARPTVRSLGRGHGSTSGWSSTTYRRLLRIVAYRGRGIRRWRDLRIALWLDGFDLDPSQIREDLHSWFGDAIVAFNNQLSTELWPIAHDAPPTVAAQSAIAARFTGQDALEGAVEKLDLETWAEFPVRLGLSTLLTVQGQRLAIAFVHQFFATGPGDLPASIRAFRASLPAPVAALFEDAERDLTAHAGMLAHPDGFDNPLLHGIADCTDTTLTNLREAVAAANCAWSAALQLATAVLEVRPEVLGGFRLLRPVLIRLSRSMAERPPLGSPEAKLGLLALGFMSESIRRNEAAKLAQAMRALPPIAKWLVGQPEILHDFEKLDGAGWTSALTASGLPPEAQAILIPDQVNP